MSTFRFIGFFEGSPVTMTLTQGADTAGPLTVPAWGQPIAGGGTGEVSISAITDGRLIAPTGVWFQAAIGPGFLVGERTTGQNTYDPSFHELEYEWTIARPAGAASTFEPTLNIPNVWKNRNVAYGKRVSFVMDEPGTYTVTCTARDWAGNVGTATWTQTVADPDVAFAGAATICFSQAGNFTGAPAGSQQFTDALTARAAYANLAGDARFLFRRGESVTIPVGFVNNAITRGRTNIRFGAFGSGAKPVLSKALADSSDFIGANTRDSYSELAVYGLRFESYWDETTEQGIATNVLNLDQFATHCLVHQCEFSGHNIALSLPSELRADPSSPQFNPATGTSFLDANSIVSECHITNWLNFGIFSLEKPNGNRRRTAIIGTSCARSPSALPGRDSDLANANAHGPVRISASQLYIASSDFFSNAGWSGANGSGWLGTDRAAQECLRVMTSAVLSGEPSGDYYVNINRVTLEGGFRCINLAANNPQNSAAFVPQNYLMHDFITLGTPQVQVHIMSQAGGTTIRNGLMIQPGSQQANQGFSQFIRWGVNTTSPPTMPANMAQPQRVHNVTGIALQSGAQNTNRNAVLLDQVFFDLWQSKVVENNVFHAPNQPVPVTSSGPFTTETIAGFTPRFIGLRQGFPLINTVGSVGSPTPSVAPGGTVVFPYPAGTNAAHFAANPPGGKTVIGMGSNWRAGPILYREQLGQLTVAFIGGGIEITNTSGVTWTPQTTTTHSGFYRLSLDRTGELPAIDTSFATPSDLPILYIPGSGSPALGGGDAGLKVRRDVLMRQRLAPFWRGAVQVSVA